MLLRTLDNLPVDSKICIYGTGDGGVFFKRFIEEYRQDIKVVCFFDSLNDGYIDNLRIININNLDKLEEKFDFIVISSRFWKEIEETLLKFGIQNYFIEDDFILEFIFGIYFEERNYIMPREIQEKFLPSVEKVISILDDDEDKKLYSLIINARFNYENEKYLFEYMSKNIERLGYQYLEHIKKDKIKTVIEGGIFDGLTTYRFLNTFKNIELIYAFDPLPENNIDSKYLTMLKNSSKVSFNFLGLWDKKDTVYFNKAVAKLADIENANNAPGENHISIETISIDEFVEENNISKIDYIKFDIENAELTALKGAKKTLISHRPQLAISIYHTIDDMIDIPIFLNDILTDYTYKIGQYSTIIETVLYAIPNELCE